MACSIGDEKTIPDVYELKMVDEDKDLECSICLLLLNEAMGTPCSHVFCRRCIQKLIGQESIENATFNCPECQQSVETNKVYPNAFLDRKVRGANVYCLQKKEGCQWTGTLNSFFEHHKEKCDYQPVGCIYEECTFLGMKSKIKDHESICEYRIVQCKHCDAELKVNALDEHYSSCEKFPTLCQQIGCDTEMPKSEIQNHLDKDCKFMMVKCSFSKFGCPEEVLRSALDQHIEESTNRHMALMCNQLSTVLSQNQDLRNEVKHLKCELSILNHASLPSVNRLLLKGIERWIKKNEDFVMEESYTEWYEKVFNKMTENKLYSFDNAMFVKVKNENKFGIYWSSNGKEEQDKASKSQSVYYRDESSKQVLRIGEDQLLIETQTLESFKCNNSKAFLLHPFDTEKNLNGGADGEKVKYNGWSMDNIPNEYYFDEFNILCLIKM